MADVAYVLATALDVSLLRRARGDDGTEESDETCVAGSVEEDDVAAEAVLQRLLAGYERALLAQLSEESQADYRARIRPSFEWCFLDYTRIAVLSLWKAVTPAIMADNTRKHGFSMVNRSPRHLEWMARRAGRTLGQLLPDL